MQAKKISILTQWICGFICFFFPKNACCLPQVSIGEGQSNRFGLVHELSYFNTLSPSTALGFDLAFGALEFRLASTWATIIKNHHVVKITADYLSQVLPVPFITGPADMWAIGHTLAAGYAYLPPMKFINALSINGYQLYSRSDSLISVCDLSDDIAILNRNMRGANAYGLVAGLSLLPWKWTQLDLKGYYDNLYYRNRFQPAADRNGFGAGLILMQTLHPRLMLTTTFISRPLYQQRQAMIKWLLPILKRDCLELSLSADYINGYIPAPNEKRVSVYLTYRWGYPVSTREENILKNSTLPLVRMPQVMVIADEQKIKPH